MQLELLPHEDGSGDWILSAIDFDGDGEIHTVIFEGPDAELWARGYLKMLTLAVGKKPPREDPMDKTQADFFRENLLPIAREAAEDDATDPRHERNPLRPMLRQMLAYIEYLEGK